jgi:signal transduction histidine kinase/ligand-binding sensor domain-containing protein
MSCSSRTPRARESSALPPANLPSKLRANRLLPMFARMAGFALASVTPLGAQELPLRAWSVRDGLIHPRVNGILRDSSGFVWFATWEGVSRFDGVRFTNFGAREGLPNPLVWCVAEGPDRKLWLGTHGGGLARIADQGTAVVREAEVEGLAARRVFEIAFDKDGRMWVVTERGVFTAQRADAGALRFEPVDELGERWFGRLLVGPDGGMLLISETELAHSEGRALQRTTFASERDLGELRAVAPRREGGVFVAYERSLHVLEWSDASAAVRRRAIELEVGANTSLFDLREDDAGRLWVATSTGLVKLVGGETQVYTTTAGLPDDWIRSLAREPEGGLWIGTHQGGVALLPDAGAAHYTRRSGLGDGHAAKLVTTDANSTWVATEVSGLFEIGSRGSELLPGSDRPPFDRLQRNIARDAAGEWWIGASDGVHHIPGGRLDLGRARVVEDALRLPPGNTFVIGLDPEGRAVLASSDGGLHVGCAGPRLDALPFAAPTGPVKCIAWLPDGSAWFSDGLALWRTSGAAVTELEPWPGARGDLLPRVLLSDSRGWMWIGTRFAGLAYSRDPSAHRPVFVRLTTAEGLVSDAIFALAEDESGNVYVGTGRGLQRYSTRAGSLETIGVADGLEGEWINDLDFDRQGDLWVAAANGVSRIRPEPLRSWRAPPRVRLMKCFVAGAELGLASGGAFDPPPIEVAARDSRLAFEFAAVDPVRGHRLRYQVRLEPLESAWSEPRAERTVRYGGLAAGEYRLALRSVDPNASEPAEPTYVAITVTPPLWARGWFVASVALVALAIGFALHRLKLRRELALERVRTQIASDLHDDIGAGLAQIAISIELARRSAGAQASDALLEIAEVARGARASMSDIVWAVDPRHDTLADAAARMRRFANDVLAASDAAVTMNVPDEADLGEVAIAPDRRRNLFLFFKEALTNVARHARAQHVEIELEVRAGRLRLAVRDDGVGFDAATTPVGNGLGNLARRARELGGEFALDSVVGRGTKIVLHAPLRASRP